MTNKIYPCLWFDGKAKAAADFYCSIFQNSKITEENPIVVRFELEGKRFMGLNGGPKYKINPSISFFVICDTLEEAKSKWDKLTNEGSVLMPLNKYPWSEQYGWGQDKFGVNWQIMMRTTDKHSEKIIPSLMFTQAQCGKAEQAINFYTSLFGNDHIMDLHRYTKNDPEIEGNIKYSLFSVCEHLFTAMDSSQPHQFTFTEGVSLVIDCDTQEEIDYLWDKLTKDGSESQCGWLKDKFGVSWQIVPAILGKLMSNPEKGKKVMEAFLKMKKFDIAKLLAV